MLFLDDLIEFKAFIDEILSNNSRLFKEATLAKYKDNDNIKYYLHFLFNPYITTGIGKKAYNRFHHSGCIDTYPTNIFSATREALEYLQAHNTSDYQTRELMFSYYMALRVMDIHFAIERKPDRNLAQLFYQLITKDLQLGIEAKTINKVIPDLVPEFQVQLANKYFDKPEVLDGKTFAITTKIDGARIIALKEHGEVSFWTRAGQKYEGLVDLEAEMLEKLPDNTCLDGEITLLDPGKLKSKEQYKATMKIVRKDGEKHGVRMLVFDYMTAEEFRAQSCNTPYIARQASLDTLIPESSMTYFKHLPVLYIGTDQEQILKLLEQQVSQGQEGIMINVVSAPYHFTRTNDLLKVKKMQDIDLEVIGFEEGINKHKGRLGALLVEFDGNTVGVGSGLSDELREEIWANRNAWLGRTISIKYFEITTNKKGGKSLRFPVYIDWRQDK